MIKGRSFFYGGYELYQSAEDYFFIIRDKNGAVVHRSVNKKILTPEEAKAEIKCWIRGI